MLNDDENETHESGTEGRWQGRPVLAALVNVAVFATPIAFSIATAALVAHVLPRPQGNLWRVGWWAAVLITPTAVLVAIDRVTRRALPLAVLLKMTMVFPDRAPGRLSVARKAGTTRNLARRLEEATAKGLADEPTRAAEEILALAGALSAHDRLTRGHAERVRTLTDLIAEELELPTEARDRLRWSALLHDVGKLAVHPDILNKRGALDEREWEVIRTHPLEGAKLVEPLAPWLGEWANTIVEHHEKYDGTGYPFGLSGRAISLGGRIVTVADCYDTMTAVRTYRKPMSPAAARAELAACAGSHFDPVVVRAFLGISLGRIRWVEGPLAWLGSLPFVSNLASASQLGPILGRVGVAAIAGVGAVSVGAANANRPAPHARDHEVTALSSAATTLHQVSIGQARVPRLPATTSIPSSVVGPADSVASPSGGPGAGPASTGLVGPGPVGSTPRPGGSGSGTAVSGGSASTTAPPASAHPAAMSLVIGNGSGVAGEPDQGDEIIVNFVSFSDPGLLCSAWAGAWHPDLTGPNVSVHMTRSPTGDDQVTSVIDSTDCSTGFHFGTIDLGQAGYLKSNAIFGGGSSQCTHAVTGGCARIHWDGSSTLTIVLGEANVTQLVNTGPSTATYTPDASLGIPGTAQSPFEVHF